MDVKRKQMRYEALLNAAAMIEQSLKAADKAVISGDIVAMMAAYKDLQEITG